MRSETLLSDRTKKIGVNMIREILKVVSRPGMVSLAGGIPSPESFPMEIMKELMETVLGRYGAGALQYDPTEGFFPLREALSEYVSNRKGISVSPEEILIASGSQGVLDAAGKVFISKGDLVAVESPTYIGALQAFNPYEPEYFLLESDNWGVLPESVEAALKTGHVKFIYLVPTFQNPTGKTISYERRVRIAELLIQYNGLLIEDDPYSDLRYEGEAIVPIKTLAPAHVVYVGTLSKIFAPGLRVGYSVAPEWVRKWMVVVKQGTDLHTGTLNQALAAEYLSGRHLDKNLPRIIDLYRPKQQTMINALDEYFPEEFKWTRPEGGMFLWAEGPRELDMDKVYREAIRRNVAFVPGAYFFPSQGRGKETMRLNFTMPDTETIKLAIRTLAEVIEYRLYDREALSN